MFKHSDLSKIRKTYFNRKKLLQKRFNIANRIIITKERSGEEWDDAYTTAYIDIHSDINPEIMELDMILDTIDNIIKGNGEWWMTPIKRNENLYHYCSTFKYPKDPENIYQELLFDLRKLL